MVLDDETKLPGLTVEQVNPAVASERRLPFDATGVVVTDPGRFGARVGLRAGDLLLAIGRSRVEEPQDVAALLDRSQRGSVVTALRGNKRIVLRF